MYGSNTFSMDPSNGYGAALHTENYNPSEEAFSKIGVQQMENDLKRNLLDLPAGVAAFHCVITIT